MRSARAGYQYSPAAKCSAGFDFSLEKTVRNNPERCKQIQLSLQGYSGQQGIHRGS